MIVDLDRIRPYLVDTIKTSLTCKTKYTCFSTVFLWRELCEVMLRGRVPTANATGCTTT